MMAFRVDAMAARLLFAAMAALVLLVALPAGAEPPQQSAEPRDQPEQTTEGGDPFGGEGVFTEAEDDPELPTISVGDVEPGLQRAEQRLEQNFSHFLERRPLGFDETLIDGLRADVQQLWEGTARLVSEPALIGPSDVLGVTLPLVVLALFVVVFFLLDRHTTRVAHRLQARVHFDVSAWMTTAVRKLILVAGRSVAFAALIVLSYFPVRALFGGAGWTLLVTDALYLFLAYRIAKTVMLTGLRLHPRNAEVMDHYARLERFGMVVLRVALMFLVVLAAIERLDYRADAAAFVGFAFRATLAVAPLYLLRTREAVLNLLPPQPDSRLYRALHSALDRNYYTLVVVTVVLLGFNAAGYVNAATFLLTRGYALIVIGAIWFALLERLHHQVVARTEHSGKEPESRQAPSQLLKTFEHWLIAIGSLVILVVSLRLLGLYGPLMALLEIPLLGIGQLQVSALNLVNVVLIIGGAILSIRLLKAVLNAQVYPAMGVDIGVAYAVNTLINYALVAVAFILCLVALGVRLSAVMVVIASLGVGIGFALQNIAENLVSGFILLFGRAVQKGDFITVNDLYGRVEAVGARSVVVRTPDNFSMLIPSKEIVSGRIVNWTFQDSQVRIHIPVGVSYDSDPTEVRGVLLDIAEQHPDILDEPEPDVWIVEFGDNSIQFELLVYFDCRKTNERALKGKFNFLVWEAFQKAGIEIPYPQRDLHLRSIGDADDNDRPDSEESGAE